MRDCLDQTSLKKRASREKFRVQAVSLQEELRGNLPGYIIRAGYGPACGTQSSSVVVFRYDAELLNVRHDSDSQPISLIEDRSGKWGPREFLHHLISAITEVHGDCAVLLTHNGLHTEVDAGSSHRWTDLSNRDPVACLLDPTRLFGCRR